MLGSIDSRLEMIGIDVPESGSCLICFLLMLDVCFFGLSTKNLQTEQELTDEKFLHRTVWAVAESSAAEIDACNILQAAWL